MQYAIFFATPADFRTWLEKNHDKTPEQWVGFYKKVSGKPSITWPESVDAALCYGWIDGLRKSIDDISYKIRFTPRKSTSNWSAIN
ncbi:bacteriocin-protection protein, partial [bacterium]|nr:bacteriocin-protection protein [bacterium]